MMQKLLLLASLGAVAVAIFCMPREEEEPVSLDPSPMQPRAKMRGQLDDVRSAAAAAENEKHEQLAAATAAEAQHVSVDSKKQAKKLKLQRHNKFE